MTIGTPITKWRACTPPEHSKDCYDLVCEIYVQHTTLQSLNESYCRGKMYMATLRHTHTY